MGPVRRRAQKQHGLGTASKLSCTCACTAITGCNVPWEICMSTWSFSQQSTALLQPEQRSNHPEWGKVCVWMCVLALWYHYRYQYLYKIFTAPWSVSHRSLIFFLSNDTNPTNSYWLDVVFKKVSSFLDKWLPNMGNGTIWGWATWAQLQLLLYLCKNRSGFWCVLVWLVFPSDDAGFSAPKICCIIVK